MFIRKRLEREDLPHSNQNISDWELDDVNDLLDAAGERDRELGLGK